MASAGIILCGGHSTRMGQPKAWLPFGEETLLARMVRVLGQAVQPIIVVGAADQPLPPLSSNISIVRDAAPDRGPLEGLAAGLRALSDTACAAFVTACDAPLLQGDFVRHVLAARLGHDAAAPLVENFPYPLTAAYHTTILPTVEKLLATDERSLRGLLAKMDTHWLMADELRAVDPGLLSLRNINTPAEYEQAWRIAAGQ